MALLCLVLTEQKALLPYVWLIPWRDFRNPFKIYPPWQRNVRLCVTSHTTTHLHVKITLCRFWEWEIQRCESRPGLVCILDASRLGLNKFIFHMEILEWGTTTKTIQFGVGGEPVWLPSAVSGWSFKLVRGSWLVQCSLCYWSDP